MHIKNENVNHKVYGLRIICLIFIFFNFINFENNEKKCNAAPLTTVKKKKEEEKLCRKQKINRKIVYTKMNR